MSPSDPGVVRTPRTVDAGRFKQAFRQHAAGVAVVTADVDGALLAFTASSVTSVSSDPAVLLFSVSMSTSTGRAFAGARSAAVHLLDGDDHALAVRCADPASDRFSDPEAWARLPTGEPVFLAPRVVLRGEVVERVALGEATVLLLAVTEVIERHGLEEGARTAPLAYVDREWHALGAGSRIG